jgi:hypothetical protein
LAADVQQILAGVFNATDERGEYRYTPEEISDVCMVLAPPPGDSGAALYAHLAARAGVEPGTPPDEIESCVASYFAEHPLNKALVRDVLAVLREHVLDSTSALQELDRMLGEAGTRSWRAPLSAPKPGEVSAGPLARHALSATLKKKPQH